MVQNRHDFDFTLHCTLLSNQPDNIYFHPNLQPQFICTTTIYLYIEQMIFA